MLTRTERDAALWLCASLNIGAPYAKRMIDRFRKEPLRRIAVVRPADGTPGARKAVAYEPSAEATTHAAAGLQP